MSNYPPPPPSGPSHPQAPPGTYLASDGKFYPLQSQPTSGSDPPVLPPSGVYPQQGYQPQQPPPHQKKTGNRIRVLVGLIGIGFVVGTAVDIVRDRSTLIEEQVKAEIARDRITNIDEQVTSGGSPTTTVAGTPATSPLDEQLIPRIYENLAVRVVGLDARHDSGDYDVVVGLDVTNKSSKAIRGFQVTFVVEATDRLGRNWNRNLRVESTTSMEPGQQSVCWDFRNYSADAHPCEVGFNVRFYSMNQSVSDEFGFWKAIDEGTFSYSIEPTFLVFEDGETIGRAR